MPQPSSDLAGYHDGVAVGELRAPYCVACTRAHWPPRPACPHCNRGEIEWRRLPNTGELFTWTVVGHTKLPDFETQTPFAVGMIAYPDLGLRIIGRIAGDPTALSFGLPLAWSPAENPAGVIWQISDKQVSDKEREEGA
ncbi:Zn-ribbon domain-containing OB-fold protein [Nocardia salmonicida]|uniref:Zn-ribbon domain-containing OB-fold protein n=1 Tax=Nocardia salmonicida TaxID=53431 RepID=UPI0036717BCF